MGINCYLNLCLNLCLNLDSLDYEMGRMNEIKFEIEIRNHYCLTKSVKPFACLHRLTPTPLLAERGSKPLPQ